MSTSIQHRDACFARSLGYPTLAVVDRDTVLVGDWSGYLHTFDLRSMSEKSHVSAYEQFQPLPTTIFSLFIEPVQRKTCAIVTRSASCLLWRVGSSKFEEL